MNLGDWELRGGGLEYFYRADRDVLEYDRHIQEVLAGRVEYVEPWLAVPYMLIRARAMQDGWELPEVSLEDAWHPLKRLLTAYAVQGVIRCPHVERAYQGLVSLKRTGQEITSLQTETRRVRKLRRTP